MKQQVKIVQKEYINFKIQTVWCVDRPNSKTSKISLFRENSISLVHTLPTLTVSSTTIIPNLSYVKSRDLKNGSVYSDSRVHSTLPRCLASAHGGDSNSPSEKPNLRSRSLILVKIWCLILVFVETFVGGISPYFMMWNEAFLITGTQFAGGVFFLGTALMHFLSDSNETFGDLTEKEYPFAFMLASAGYLLTMLADSVISYVYGKQKNNFDPQIQGSRKEKGSVNGIPSHSQLRVIYALDSSKKLDRTVRGEFEKCIIRPHLTGSRKEKGSVNGIPSHSQLRVKTDTKENLAKHSLTSATSLRDDILLIFALCFHSVFEGVAIGVAETKADARRALWTVYLHQIFATIAMGIALLRMILDRPLLSCVAYAFAFAISSPIGIAIGIIIDATTQGTITDWIYAISMGLACGVFIYVSISHLLSMGYKPQKSASIDMAHRKFLVVLFSIGVIVVIMIWDT
ncbi:zinc transporter 2-like [Olea europaea var. sylvestris]|uniref:zinc transporter 2-like n=1 Tax=Olea europaea var. sylvestris TaxID=158386 RepID=UPI000C1CDD00|nr:zinc transporter 2-like [Olea europaea var. sylvestris]